MLNINFKSECTGCGACAARCPAKCLKMVPDEEGFMYPVISEENCTGCGLCAKECPVGAIDADNPLVLDAGKCISCMRCVSVCPKQARGCDAALMAMLAEKMAPLLSGHKENHLFL